MMCLDCVCDLICLEWSLLPVREMECTLELLTENGERERGWCSEDEVLNGDLIGRALESKGDLFLFIMRSSEHSFFSEDV